jgi:hypothetical protein
MLRVGGPYDVDVWVVLLGLGDQCYRVDEPYPGKESPEVEILRDEVALPPPSCQVLERALDLRV